MPRGRDPKSIREWREAATLAEVMLSLQSARAYGFVSGGPDVDTARCESILRQAKARGIVPRADEIDAAIRSLARGA